VIHSIIKLFIELVIISEKKQELNDYILNWLLVCKCKKVNSNEQANKPWALQLSSSTFVRYVITAA
jgi:hypothetical protein